MRRLHGGCPFWEAPGDHWEAAVLGCIGEHSEDLGWEGMGSVHVAYPTGDLNITLLSTCPLLGAPHCQLQPGGAPGLEKLVKTE